MRRMLCFLFALLLLAGNLSGCGKHSVDGRTTINVYNWGQYISEGDDGYLDVISAFEEAHPDIKVNYVTFDSNETMYTKMAGGETDTRNTAASRRNVIPL